MSGDSKVCIPYANRELIGSTLLLMCTEGDDHVIKLIKLEITRREEQVVGEEQAPFADIFFDNGSRGGILQRDELHTQKECYDIGECFDCQMVDM